MRIALFTIAIVLFGHSASSSGQPGYVVYGQGSQSCGRWTQLNKDRQNREMHTWVVGFVSGAGFTSTKVLAETDSDAIAAWVNLYCAGHPLDQVADAAGALVGELGKRR